MLVFGDHIPINTTSFGAKGRMMVSWPIIDRKLIDGFRAAMVNNVMVEENS